MNTRTDASATVTATVPDEIMVVDDTPENLKLLSALLMDHGYRVRPASSGAMALRSAAARAPELILLDVRMPDMDGYAVCRRIKADARLRAVPVIFISAMDDISDKIKGFDAGAVDYLTKPFDSTEVLVRVRTQLDLGHLRQRQAQAQEELERQVAVRTAELAAANRALMESEERLRLVFEATSDGVWDWNPGRGSAFFSDRWYAMLGYLPGEFPATCDEWRRRVHPDDIAGAEAALHAHYAGETSEYSAEFRMLGKSGKWRWIHARGKVIEQCPDGQPARVLGTHASIDERKRAEAEIAAALLEKEVLLKEISHRVKNNLQVVSSLLTMRANVSESPELQAVLNESADRVRSIALVHEQLYQSKNLSRIEIARYIEQLVAHLANTYDPVPARVPIRAECDNLSFGVETAVPLGLIVTELISNAYKHAFPSQATGEIWVRLARLPSGEVQLSVRDTGKGLPAKGNGDRPGSLGLRLVNRLTDQLEGRLEVTSPDGACFVITFNPAGQTVTHMTAADTAGTDAPKSETKETPS